MIFIVRFAEGEKIVFRILSSLGAPQANNFGIIFIVWPAAGTKKFWGCKNFMDPLF